MSQISEAAVKASTPPQAVHCCPSVMPTQDIMQPLQTSQKDLGTWVGVPEKAGPFPQGVHSLINTQ